MIRSNTSLPFGFVTIATGSSFYTEMAVDLALSLRVFHDDDIVLLTDAAGKRYVEGRYKDVFSRIVVLPRKVSRGFDPKCLLADYAPLDHAVYLDADCLVVSPLTDVRACALAGGMTMIGQIEDVVPGQAMRHNKADISGICASLALTQFFSNHGAVYAYERQAARPVMHDAHAMFLRLKRMNRRTVPFPSDEIAFGLVAPSHAIQSFLPPSPVHWSSDLKDIPDGRWFKPVVHFHAMIGDEHFARLMADVVKRRRSRNFPTAVATAAWRKKRSRKSPAMRRPFYDRWLGWVYPRSLRLAGRTS